MVTTNSGSDANRVTITNNFAKYYADSALNYANQAKMYADNAKQTESELTQFIANSSLSTISDNIETINYVAENMQNLDKLSFEWGNITGDISLQSDLKLALDGKANITDVYTKTEIDTKLGEIETLLEGV